jgi:hypothetical protein
MSVRGSWGKESEKMKVVYIQFGNILVRAIKGGRAVFAEDLVELINAWGTSTTFDDNNIVFSDRFAYPRKKNGIKSIAEA